jgi:hypothetical protein
MSGKYAQAIDHYVHVLRLNPNLTSAYFNLASTYSKNNQSAEAIDTAEKGGSWPDPTAKQNWRNGSSNGLLPTGPG